MENYRGFKSVRSAFGLTNKLLLGILILAASNSKSASYCSADIASTTTYFVPRLADYCKKPKPCSRFKRAVRMQGSGTLPGNMLLTYTGKKIPLGSCETAFGASGQCLTPYISVAADPRYYSMGDIIEMPSLKGMTVILPNGKTMIHPGFLIVQDTGGAIRGANRFDFFTGSHRKSKKDNLFGSQILKASQMMDKMDCSYAKKFSVIRRRSSFYENSLVAIEDALRDSYTNIIVASKIPTQGVN